MPYVADLHIHSRFSRACSPQLTIPNLAKWAKYKGIDLLGTGDFLHPLWLSEIKQHLKPQPSGLHELDGTKFLLTTEVACIYSHNGRVRRIHILIFLPNIDYVEKLSEALRSRGVNLSSDGRPMMGLSTQQLCETVFKVCPKAIIVPAHIWTPWFSLYGSNSGYDFFKECFGEFSDKIYAIETGLSSEPAMNWRIADLDSKTILSFSDPHSLPRLARECTVFKGNLSYDELLDDLQKNNLIGTIEFFPEEGKYHYSGHRNCNIVYSADELKKKGPICPVCQKQLTIGVMQRIEDLATRSQEDLKLETKEGVTTSKTFPNRPGFKMLVQLEEIIAEALETSVSSIKVKTEYEKLVTNLDNELKILTKTPLDLISMMSGEKLAEGVKRIREGKVHIEPGFDNTYGIVKIWDEAEIKEAPGEKKDKKQIGLFE